MKSPATKHQQTITQFLDVLAVRDGVDPRWRNPIDPVISPGQLPIDRPRGTSAPEKGVSIATVNPSEAKA